MDQDSKMEEVPAVKQEPIDPQLSTTPATTTSDTSVKVEGVKKEDEKKTVVVEKKEVDSSVFWDRLKRFFDTWKRSSWGGENKTDAPVGSVLAVFGKVDEDASYTRLGALQLHLFGYELFDAVMLFVSATSTLHMLVDPKAADILGKLGASFEGVHLSLIAKTADRPADIAKVVEIISSNKPSQRTGVVKKELGKGAFATDVWAAIGKAAGVVQIDISPQLYSVFAVKDNEALKCIRRAGSITTEVMKHYAIQEIETVIDEEKKVKHSKLSDMIEAVLQNPKKVKVAVRQDLVDSCYSPIVQSGGKYDLRASASSNDDNLHYGTIVVALGARYKSYCSNIARTLFVNAGKDQREVYELLIEIYAECLKVMRPKNKLSAVYESAVALINKKRKDLLPLFVKNCGFGIGLEFREAPLLLDAKNDRLFEPNTVFNLSLGFSGVKRQSTPEQKLDANSQTYAVLIADTIAITLDEPEKLTSVNRTWASLSYQVEASSVAASGTQQGAKPAATKDDKKPAAKPAAKPGDKKDQKSAIPVVEGRVSTRGQTRGKAQKPASEYNEQKVREHQRKLHEAMVEAAKERIQNGDIKSAEAPELLNPTTLLSYNSPADIPKDFRADRIHVHPEKESVLFPIAGKLVPFHIHTIRSVVKKAEGSTASLQVNFLTPDAGAQAKHLQDMKQFHYVRELIYRGKDADLTKVADAIKLLKKNITAKAKEKAAKDKLVAQEQLVRDASGATVAKLTDLSVRPLVSRKKASGSLTAVANGMRFITSDKAHVDITYKNIKHAIFQPAYKDTTQVILHFQFHNPIMVGKKASNFIQFYYEVIEASQEVDAKRSSIDEDEIQKEQQERLNRKKWNEKFRLFAEQVDKTVQKRKLKWEFDMPYSEQAFQGVPNKGAITLYPTSSCVVALDDTPPFLLDLEEVEIAVFERVNFSLKNFDLAFIFKDYTKPVQQITAIPSTYIDALRAWLNSKDILFFESPSNWAWPRVMKTIVQDIEDFWENDGWASFLTKPDDEEEDDEEASDYEPDDSDAYESTSDDDDDDYSGDDDDGGDDDDDGDGEDDDWDAHERKFAEADRKREMEERSDNARSAPPKKRAKH